MQTPTSFHLTTSAGVPERMLEQARSEARAVGYAQGWTQGLREASNSQAAALAAADAELAERNRERLASMDTAVAAIVAASDRLAAEHLALTDAITDQILSAALELASALLGRELQDPIAAASAALARVLAQAPDREPITIRLSPADYQTLTTVEGAALTTELNDDSGRSLVLEYDPALTSGDAVARASSTSIDARLSLAVRRLRDYVAAP